MGADHHTGGPDYNSKIARNVAVIAANVAVIAYNVAITIAAKLAAYFEIFPPAVPMSGLLAMYLGVGVLVWVLVYQRTRS